ncbi:MAG: ATP-binding protein [Mobilitalea sp.]
MLRKTGRCVSPNAALKVKGIIHAPMLINDYDICTIFANALDNAIEACEKMETNRWIEVSIGLHQNFLTVLISNSFAGPVSLRSKKQDRKNHGFGLQNLTECVERNNGVVRRRMDKDKFVLDIVVSAF